MFTARGKSLLCMEWKDGEVAMENNFCVCAWLSVCAAESWAPNLWETRFAFLQETRNTANRLGLPSRQSPTYKYATMRVLSGKNFQYKSHFPPPANYIPSHDHRQDFLTSSVVSATNRDLEYLIRYVLSSPQRNENTFLWWSKNIKLELPAEFLLLITFFAATNTDSCVFISMHYWDLIISRVLTKCR